MNHTAKVIDEHLFKHLTQMMPKGILYDACKHALTGGKRIRSSIVLGMAGYASATLPLANYSLEPEEPALLAAISVEYLHNASLIIDDLPCMDNDIERRGVPTVHAKYGERVAQLASTSLMAAAIETLANAADALDKSNALFVIKFVAGRMGSEGASGGEIKEFQKDAQIEEVIHMKTSTFFEISMILGWLFGPTPRDVKRCEDISKAAKYLGIAYQIADDMEDIEQDTLHEASRNVNYVIKNGFDVAVSDFEDALIRMKNVLPEEAWCEPLQRVVDLLTLKSRSWSPP